MKKEEIPKYVTSLEMQLVNMDMLVFNGANSIDQVIINISGWICWTEPAIVVI